MDRVKPQMTDAGRKLLELQKEHLDLLKKITVLKSNSAVQEYMQLMRECDKVQDQIRTLVKSGIRDPFDSSTLG